MCEALTFDVHIVNHLCTKTGFSEPRNLVSDCIPPKPTYYISTTQEQMYIIWLRSRLKPLL